MVVLRGHTADSRLGRVPLVAMAPKAQAKKLSAKAKKLAARFFDNGDYCGLELLTRQRAMAKKTGSEDKRPS